jgi:hypothetical protein
MYAIQSARFSMSVLVMASWLLLVTSLSSEGIAQQQYRLSSPQSGANVDAALTNESLQVTDAQGKVTVYIRDARFDSADGLWLAFYSRSLNQVIRWPQNNTGNVQIGDMVGGEAVYRASQMVISALPRNPVPNVQPPAQNILQEPAVRIRPGLDPLADPTNAAVVNTLASLEVSPLFNAVITGGQSRAEMLYLTNIDPRGALQYLSRDLAQGVMLDLSPNRGHEWWVAPAGDFVRIQHYQDGIVTALSVGRGNSLTRAPLAQDSRQLWRISPFGGDQKRFLIESAMYVGNCLTATGGEVTLQPISYAPTQAWLPLSAVSPPTFEPFWRNGDQQVQANSPLPPAQVTLLNSHRNNIMVLVNDQRNNSVQQIRIPAGQSATVMLDRDPGATIVESYEIRSITGLWESQQFVTTVPPRVFYDLSVYEDFLQSIAIDRTGKSPNPIEDINVVPKSVGWIIVPPGAQLPQNSSIDVFPQAQAANNAGAVRRLDPRQFDRNPANNPLEAILNEVQGLPRRGF